MTQTPMLTAALAPELDPTGYRAFRVKVGADGRFELYAATGMGRSPREYPAGRALCRSLHPCTDVPGVKCTCGFYAYRDEGGASTYAANTARLMAEVRGHGTMQFHEFGWRAEYLQILRFYWPLCHDCDAGADVHAHVDAVFYDAPAIMGTRRRARRLIGGGLRMFCAGHAPDDGVTTNTAIDGLVRDVAERFQASVYDREATAALLAKNEEWKRQIRARLTEQFTEKVATWTRRAVRRQARSAAAQLQTELAI